MVELKRCKNGSIHRGLLKGYVSSMMIAAIFTIIIAVTLQNQLADTNRAEIDHTTITLLRSYMERELEDIEILSQNIMLSQALQSYLDDGTQSMQLDKEILGHMATYTNSIQSVYIVDNEDQVRTYITEQCFDRNEAKLLGEAEIMKEEAQTNEAYWTIGTDGYINHQAPALIMKRRLVSKENYETMGYMMIVLRQSYMDTLYREVVGDITYQAALLEINGMTLKVGHESEMIDGVELKYVNTPPVDYETQYKNERVVTQPSELLGGNIVLVGEDVVEWDMVVYILMALGIVNFVFFIIYNIYIKNYIISPLKNITQMIHQTKNIEYTEILEDRDQATNELEQIEEALHGLVERVDTLMKEAEERHRHERNLELQVITNQVKPHFLFNMLNVGRGLIACKEYDSAKKLIGTLASYYRAWLSKGNQYITLKEEVAILEDYIRLMKISDNIQFEITIHIDEALMGYKVPKLMLQPIVENAFKYGLKTMDTPIHIQVRGCLDEQTHRMYLSVEDDGKGFDEGVLAKFHKGEDLEGQVLEGKSGFGLKSIRERLQLYYGEEQTLTIDSEAGKYSRITLMIPVERTLG